MEKEEAKEWKKIPRISRTIPFGYEIDPDDPNVLLPIPLELEALKLAKKHIKNFSYRQVADWIYSVTGRKISHVGLKNRLSNEERRAGTLKSIKIWAKRYEKTLQKIEDFENKVGTAN